MLLTMRIFITFATFLLTPWLAAVAMPVPLTNDAMMAPIAIQPTTLNTADIPITNTVQSMIPELSVSEHQSISNNEVESIDMTTTNSFMPGPPLSPGHTRYLVFFTVPKESKEAKAILQELTKLGAKVLTFYPILTVPLLICHLDYLQRLKPFVMWRTLLMLCL
ncbi:hypothetical protein BDF19DRAFT_448661, partial [Syncephalis fuscata]